MIKIRDWQTRALEKFGEHRPLSFLLSATPGAGKTIFSGLCFASLLQTKIVEFAIIIVPTTALKGDRDAGFLGDWHKIGIELTTILKNGRDHPSEFRGGIVTYQQLPNIISTLETWAANGVRMFTVFDEIHHASEDNEWGSASERLARCSTKILGMTGTPFRGDRRKISFVSYDDKGCAKADFEYAYRDAVNENVCRPVQFMTDDGIAEFIMYQEQEKVRLSEAITDDHVRGASGTIFRSDSNWMKAFIERADASIDEYRNIDADAGGLIVCRPGIDEERDERYLRQIAKLVKDVTGENPEVVSHEDPDANAKIEKFRTSTQRWICAVRKISEGVDIKRLRVLVMATRPTTELLFRQLVGRIVRVKNPQSNNPEKREYATAYIAKFPQLKEWAEKLAEEAEAGLAEKPKERKPSDDPDPTSSMFTALGSTHEKGGAISDYGDQFTAAEINAAEKDKNGDPQLLDIPITKLAYLRRKFGMIANDEQTSNDPLQIEKKRIRDEINKTARRLAIKRSPDNPDYRIVWRDLHKHTGARNIDDLMDNHSIDVMRQALHLIHGWLGGKDAVA